MKSSARVLKQVGALVALIVLLGLIPTQGQAEIALVGTAGAGLFVAADKDYYGGISTDLYPEIGAALDISIIRLGLKFGYIYRKVTIDEWFWDGWNYYSYHLEYTLAYLPVQGEILIAPLRGQTATPYFGLMVGAFIPTGDNDKVVPAISPKLGLEMNLEPLLVYGDIRYTYAPYSDIDRNVGGFMIVVGMGLRLGLGG